MVGWNGFGDVRLWGKNAASADRPIALGASAFDQQLGVWHNVDPKAEANCRHSPYMYCRDNPINFVDPDGMQEQAASGQFEDEWNAILTSAGDLLNSMQDGEYWSFSYQGRRRGWRIEGGTWEIDYGNNTTTSSSQGSSIIAKSSLNTLGGPDAESGNCKRDPAKACVGQYDWYYARNEYLWNSMKALFKFCSMGKMEDAALAMVEYFKQNDNLGSLYKIEGIESEVLNCDNFKKFVSGLKDLIRKELIANGGSFEKLISKPVRTSLFAFDDFWDKFGGLQIMINQVSNIEVALVSSNVNRNTGDVSATYQISLYDDFGLDDADVCKYVGYHSGFAAWWTLQHCKEFKPFVSLVQITVTHNFNLTK
jgi:RHS repeat-associated protein